MARQRRQAAQQVDRVEVSDAPDDQFYDEQIESAISKALEQSDGEHDYDIRVYQMGDRNQEFYIFTIDHSEFPILDRLRDEFGTGHYRVRVYRDGQLWRRKDYRVKSSRPPIAPAPPATSPASSSEPSRVETLLLQLIAKMSPAAPATSATDIATMMDKSFERALSLVTVFKDRIAPPVTAPVDQTSMLLKGIELAEKLQRDGSGETSLAGLARSVLESPLMQKLVENFPQQPQPAAPPAPAQQIPPPAAAVPGSGAAAGPSAVSIDGALNYLLGRAEAGSDPRLYAEWLYDNVSLQVLSTLLAQANLVEQLASGNARIAARREWFTTLIESVRQIAQDEGARAEQGNANGADVSLNGTAGWAAGGEGNAQGDAAPDH